MVKEVLSSRLLCVSGFNNECLKMLVLTCRKATVTATQGKKKKPKVQIFYYMAVDEA